MCMSRLFFHCTVSDTYNAHCLKIDDEESSQWTLSLMESKKTKEG